MDLPRIPLACAVAKLLIHLPVLHRFGWHHDELYFIACGNHLSFGYVDHAPLVPWIARIATILTGPSIFGLRIFATLAGAATILIVGLLTRRLGGGRYAQLLACIAWLVAPVAMRTGNMLAIPSFEPLFWALGALLVVRMLQEENPRLWTWLGVVIGFGLLTKHSMLFFCFGLGVGTLVTPLRRQLRTPWPWVGAAIALAMFAPNIVWQMLHEWPTAGFLRELNENVMAGISKLQFIAGQFLYINPLSSFVWIWGLIFLFSRAGKPYRVLGVIWLSVFLLLLATDSKIYYFSPAYPAVIAAGGVAIERWLRDRRRWIGRAFLALALAGGLAFAPAALPYLSMDAIDRYMRAVTFGAMDNIYELTGDLHGMFGWPERIDALVEVWGELPPAGREQTMILAGWYGTAGAVDLLGRERGLPPVVSWGKTNWMWADPSRSLDRVVAFGVNPDLLEQIFEEVEIVRSLDLEQVSPWDRPFRIAICRKPRLTMAKLWPQLRPW
jgi:hypothetical protein